MVWRGRSESTRKLDEVLDNPHVVTAGDGLDKSQVVFLEPGDRVAGHVTHVGGSLAVEEVEELP